MGWLGVKLEITAELKMLSVSVSVCCRRKHDEVKIAYDIHVTYLILLKPPRYTISS